MKLKITVNTHFICMKIIPVSTTTFLKVVFFIETTLLPAIFMNSAHTKPRMNLTPIKVEKIFRIMNLNVQI